MRTRHQASRLARTHLTRAAPTRQRGVAILESVIAALVVGAGSAALLKMHASMVDGSSVAKRKTEAVSVATSKLEELRAVMLKTEHTQLDGADCVPGTMLQSGSDEVPGSNGIGIQRQWAVSATCDPSYVRIDVSASWGDKPEETLTLGGAVGWSDPARKIEPAGAANAGDTPLGKNAWRPSTPILYDTLPAGAVNNGDGTFVVRQAADGRYEVLERTNGGQYQVVLQSNVELVKLSGLVAVHSSASVNMTRLRVVPSGSAYCGDMLRFGNQNSADTYGLGNGTVSSSNDRAGAYTCYVPIGWNGNLALMQQGASASCGFKLLDGDRGGSCNYPQVMACPGNSGSPALTGQRAVRVLVTDNAGRSVGQTGVQKWHERMVSPGNSPLSRTERLDFAVYVPGNGKNANTCASIFSGVGSGISGNVNNVPFAVTLRNGAGTNSDQTYGVPSIRWTNYVLDACEQNRDCGSVTISGNQASCSAPLVATGQGASSDKNFLCSITGSTYSCTVTVGWSGRIGQTVVNANNPNTNIRCN